MRRLVLFLGLLILLVGCQTTPVIITATSVQPATLAPTDIATTPPNPHADLPPFSWVNINPDLSGRPVVTQVWGRGIAQPPNYKFVYTSPDSPPLPPFVYNQTDGYRLEPAWIRGTWGYREEGIELYPHQRYLIKVIYSTSLSTQSEANLDVGGHVYNSSGGSDTPLTPHAVPLRSDHREDIWVIETDKPYPTIALDVTFTLGFASVSGGGITFHAIQVLTAPADFGSDALLRF